MGLDFMDRVAAHPPRECRANLLIIEESALPREPQLR